MRVAWLVPRAHGTPTMKLWSFDVRSWGPSQAALMKCNWRTRKEKEEGGGQVPFLLAERAR